MGDVRLIVSLLQRFRSNYNAHFAISVSDQFALKLLQTLLVLISQMRQVRLLT